MITFRRVTCYCDEFKCIFYDVVTITLRRPEIVMLLSFCGDRRLLCYCHSEETEGRRKNLNNGSPCPFIFAPFWTFSSLESASRAGAASAFASGTCALPAPPMCRTPTIGYRPITPWPTASTPYSSGTGPPTNAWTMPMPPPSCTTKAPTVPSHVP